MAEGDAWGGGAPRRMGGEGVSGGRPTGWMSWEGAGPSNLCHSTTGLDGDQRQEWESGCLAVDDHQTGLVLMGISCCICSFNRNVLITMAMQAR